MADFNVNIKCDGAAFNLDAGYQLSKILDNISEKLMHGALDYQTVFPLIDLNGNTVGEAVYNPDTEF